MAKYVLEFPYEDEEGFGRFFLNPETGEVVENLEDLEIDPSALEDLEIIDGYEASKNPSIMEEPKTPTEKKLLIEGGADDRPGDSSGIKDRTPANNYGYMDSPRALDFVGMLPGIPGIMGKAVEGMINHNNVTAVNKARESMGLPSKNMAMGILSEMGPRNSQGLVANVDINNKNYAVGLEAMNRGRTTLTPNEARNRGLMSPVGLRELDKKEAKEAQKEFKENKDKSPTEIPDYMVSPEPVQTASPVEPVYTSPLGEPTVSTPVPETYDTEMPGLSRNVFDMAAPIDWAGRATVEPDIKNNVAAAGLGLMGVSPSFADRVQNGINYSHPERGPVSAGLTDRTREMMDALAVNTPGGINVTSAYRSPEVNAAVGGSPRSQHSLGGAFDISTRGMTDTEKRDAVERGIMSGAMELGTYPDQSLHFASVQRVGPLEANVQPHGGVTAMFDRSRYNYDEAPDWFKSGVEESRLAPTPTPRPDPSTVPGFMNTIASKPVDIENLTVEKPTQVGIQWDDKAKELSAKTLAGEIDLSKTDLTTPEGRREAFGIMSTIENRSAKTGSVIDTITEPKQYSTWNDKTAASTAQKNYELNKDLYDGIVNEYIGNPQNNLGFTSYHANYVDPDWSGKMAERSTIGAHTFGILSEYTAPAQGMVTDFRAPTPDFVQPSTVFNSQTPGQAMAAAGVTTGFMDTPTTTASSSTPDTQSQNSQNSNSSNSSSSSSSGGEGSYSSGFSSSENSHNSNDDNNEE